MRNIKENEMKYVMELNMKSEVMDIKALFMYFKFYYYRVLFGKWIVNLYIYNIDISVIAKYDSTFQN